VGLLAALFAIEQDFQADTSRQREGLTLLLREPPQRAAVMVAREAGRVVGMASAQLVISTAEGAPSAWIEDVVIAASHRGRGLARDLLAALLDWAGQQGATRAQLLADGGNEPALGFYRHLGWETTRLGAWRVFLRRS
jgi:GNAT superfamily N-acetyltransferase